MRERETETETETDRQRDRDRDRERQREKERKKERRRRRRRKSSRNISRKLLHMNNGTYMSKNGPTINFVLRIKTGSRVHDVTSLHWSSSDSFTLHKRSIS